MVTLTNISRTEKRELRDLGWSVLPRTAKRPPAIPTRDVLRIGEDVVFDDHDREQHLIQLDDSQ